MHVDLSGRNVLVTGASRGIGRAIALALGRAGARVAVHASRPSDAADAVAAACPAGSAVFPADLSDLSATDALFPAVIAAFGEVHVLVNNAGLAVEMPLSQPLDAWARGWDLTMTVNLRAAELLSRHAVRHFAGRGGGRLIHVASRAAFRGDTPEYMAYAASKAGMVALSRSLARGYGKQGVCSFVIAPGFVRTDMAADFIARYGDAHVANDLALDRLTEPDDLAPLAVLLASGLADHATGTSIDVNAGSYVH